MFSKKYLLLILFLVSLSSLIGCTGVHVHKRMNAHELHVAGCKLALSIPASFTQSDERVGGETDNPTYFYFKNDLQKIYISGWFASQSSFPGMDRIHEDIVYTNKMVGRSAPLDIKYEKVSNWNTIIYDLSYPEYTNAHMRAQWLEAGTWLDLHLSIVTKESSSEARLKLMSVLRMLEVKILPY